MAISTVFKGIFAACLLVGVLSQSTGQPEVSRAPEVTRAPEVSRTPEVTRAPEVSRAPEDLSPRKTSELQEDLSPREVARLRLSAIRRAEEKLSKEQASRASYKFDSLIDDKIMDNMQQRSETRNGLNVTGSYMYSDGYFRRSVEYVADENGFRIISEKVEPLGDGPNLNAEGVAHVRTTIAGEKFQYNITKADIGHLRQLRPTEPPSSA